ncbi:uncharacterized protein [Dendropsophus ebraccatus]|uniref:uncharacterized protein n=1 Tax=Dendropsophus ebraccatus TaxID=150705 RepID=UPI00383130A4
MGHPGMYKGHGDDRCKYCRDGEYQISWGGERCEVCPIGHYCPSPDINPISCPEDAFCPAGSTEPSYCMETFLRKEGDSCTLAPFTIIMLIVCAVGWTLYSGWWHVTELYTLDGERWVVLRKPHFSYVHLCCTACE